MNTVPQTMLAAAAFAAVLVTLPAHAEEPGDVYSKLAALRGAKYQRAREAFLELPDAAKFLGERARKSPEDWLAAALLARTGDASHARAFDKSAAMFAQARFGVQVGEDFDERAFWSYPRPRPDGLLPLRNFWANLIPQRWPSDGISRTVPQFDWMVELALELEWAVMNPEDLPTNHRASVFYGRLDFELSPCHFEDGPHLLAHLKDSSRAYERQSVATFDGPRLEQWLIGLRDGEHEGFVRACSALALPGAESSRTLRELSREDSFLGAFAALMVSGRAFAARSEPAFDAAWLDDWIRQARGHQIRALEEVFLGREHGLNPDDLRVPPMVVGLVLKHHAADVIPKLKQVYSKTVESSLEYFLNLANSEEPDLDEGYLMDRLLQNYPASPLWPKSAAERLAAVKGKNPKVLEFATKAKAQIGQREYPRAEDLQAMFGPRK